jgi:hypothetical protein
MMHGIKRLGYLMVQHLIKRFWVLMMFKWRILNLDPFNAEAKGTKSTKEPRGEIALAP